MRLLALALVLMTGLLSVGCDMPPMSQDIDHIDLHAGEAAVNLDSNPAPDGVRVKLYLYRGTNQGADTVIGDGVLDLLMFLGQKNMGTIETETPYHTWSFTREQLLRFRAQYLGLWYYRMILRWSFEKLPTTHTITLIARYRPVHGSDVFSEPVTVPMQLD